jgi:hypothetical protein
MNDTNRLVHGFLRYNQIRPIVMVNCWRRGTAWRSSKFFEAVEAPVTCLACLGNEQKIREETVDQFTTLYEFVYGRLRDGEP